MPSSPQDSSHPFSDLISSEVDDECMKSKRPLFLSNVLKINSFFDFHKPP
jgi:hypothetical protein